jgi:hypothetical protein
MEQIPAFAIPVQRLSPAHFFDKSCFGKQMQRQWIIFGDERSQAE